MGSTVVSDLTIVSRWTTKTYSIFMVFLISSFHMGIGRDNNGNLLPALVLVVGRGGSRGSSSSSRSGNRGSNSGRLNSGSIMSGSSSILNLFFRIRVGPRLVVSKLAPQAVFLADGGKGGTHSCACCSHAGGDLSLRAVEEVGRTRGASEAPSSSSSSFGLLLWLGVGRMGWWLETIVGSSVGRVVAIVGVLVVEVLELRVGLVFLALVLALAPDPCCDTDGSHGGRHNQRHPSTESAITASVVGHYSDRSVEDNAVVVVVCMSISSWSLSWQCRETVSSCQGIGYREPLWFRLSSELEGTLPVEQTRR